MADTPSLEVRIAKLEAAESIRALLAHYALALDAEHDNDRLHDLFTDDAVWDGGEYGTYRGLAEILSNFDDNRDAMPFGMHYMVAPVVVVGDDLDTAAASWYLFQPCSLREAHGVTARPTWIMGNYQATLRSVSGAWKFEHVSLAVKAMSPVDAGWEVERFVPGLLGHRVDST